MRNGNREGMSSSGGGHQDGVEITSIGVLYRGPLEKKYWSSSRGKEKYPYPIGYHATRWHGGHCYFMEVSEGPRGPSFVVKCEEGITCSGQTPSVVWEDILKKKHAGAKRVLVRSSCTSIDGAEMFGFTNPLVQRLCRDLVVSASGATENSNSVPDDEVEEGKEDAEDSARRSQPESSEKSLAKARKGKKSIESSRNKNVAEGAKGKVKNVRLRVASEPEEEKQETKETKKQKLKRAATELEVSRVVKVVERTQISTKKDNNYVAAHQSEHEDLPSSKRSKLPKPKVAPHADEDPENVGTSQNVSSARSRRLKYGTKRSKGEDRPEGQTSKDSRQVSPPLGLSDGGRQDHIMVSIVKDAQGSTAADFPISEINIHGNAKSVPQTTSTSDVANVEEASQGNTSSRKKRMKLAKSQKITDIVKPEKYDTQVDLTQSEGFLSVDLMCPSAEDVKLQTSEGQPGQKMEDVPSEQDGYLMLLAASKVAEVEKMNVAKEKTSATDVRRKRPLSDVDSSKSPKPAPEVVCFHSSITAPRLSVGHVVGVNDLDSSSSIKSLEDEIPNEKLHTDSAPGKDDISDIKYPLKTVEPGTDGVLSGPRSEEDVISHDKLEHMDVCSGEGERSLKSHSEMTMENQSDKFPERKEDENGLSNITERRLEPEQVHARSVNSSLKSNVVDLLLLHEQMSKDLEGTGSAVQEDEALKDTAEVKRGMIDSSPLENEETDDNQSEKVATAFAESSATCTVVSSDDLPLKKDVNERPLKVLTKDSGRIDILGENFTALKDTSSPKALESVAEVAKAEENNDPEQPQDCVVKMNILSTTCDFQTAHLSAGAAVNDDVVCDEDLPCKELQGSRSMKIDEEQETSSSLMTIKCSNSPTTVSRTDPKETNQPVLSVQTFGGGAEMAMMGHRGEAIDEPSSPVVLPNRIDTGSVECHPQHLIPKLQQPQDATLMKEMKPDVELSGDFAAKVPLTGISQGDSSQGVNSGGQSSDLLRPTPVVGLGTPPLVVDGVEFDPCISTQDTTEEQFPAMLEGVKGTGSGFEMKVGGSSEIPVHIRLSSNQRVESTTVSREDRKVPSLDVDGCKGTEHHLKAQTICSSNGNLDAEMVLSAVVDTMKSVVEGSRASGEKDKLHELVPATMEALKGTESVENFGYVNSSENRAAPVICEDELVSVPLGARVGEQVFDPKGGCTEIADRIKECIDTTKSPVNQTAGTDAVSSDPLVEKANMNLADRGPPSVLKELSLALVQELVLTEASGTDVKVSSSTDMPSPTERRSQVFNIECRVENSYSPVLVSHQAGCPPHDIRGTSDKQKLRATGDGSLLMQGQSKNPATSPGHLGGENFSSRQLVDSVFELEETKHPELISTTNESVMPVATSVTLGTVEREYVQVDARPTTNRDVTMVEAVSLRPSQMQSIASSQNASQKSESDSADRELTTSIMKLLLPEALPFIPSNKKVGKKETSVIGEDLACRTGYTNVRASVSLVASGYHSSELPEQVDFSAGSAETSRVSCGESRACKISTTVGIVQQLRSVNDPEPYRSGSSSVQVSDDSCPMEIDPGVNAGKQDLSLNGKIQEQPLLSEVSYSDGSLACQISASLEERKSSELQAETDKGMTTVGKARAENFGEKFALSDALRESADDDFKVFQPLLSSAAINSDRSQDNPMASVPKAAVEVANERPNSCVTSQTVSVSHSNTQDSVEGPILRTSVDASAFERAAHAQQEAQVSAEVADSDLHDKSLCTADVKLESAYERLDGCDESGVTASKTFESHESDRVLSSKSVPGAGLKLSTTTHIPVEAEVSLLGLSKPQMRAVINCQIHDVGEDQSVHREEIQSCGDSELVDYAESRSKSSRKLESTSGSSLDVQSDVLRSRTFCGKLDDSLDTTRPATVSDSSAKINQTDSANKLRPGPVEIQPSYLQKLELPISIEHPIQVSTLVLNVRGNEIRLCVCCGTASERTLSVFSVVNTEDAYLEHQLVSVLETSYSNHYHEEGRIKVSEESGISFTPDGQQLILTDSFQLRHASDAGSHDHRGLKIVSLEKECQSSTRLESEGVLLCLAVREPQRLIAAGEGGHINFWDLDPDWRSFGEKVSLPKATLGGVPFRSVTSLLVLPHLQHMVAGCNPSGLFALWDMDSGTLLSSCQMFDDVLLNVSSVDTKNMKWEQPVLPEDSVHEDTSASIARGETEESLAGLPLVCLLTMVTSKETCVQKSNEDLRTFEEHKQGGNEEQRLTPPEALSRDIDAIVQNSNSGTSNSNERTPQHPSTERRNFEDLKREAQNSTGEMELRSTDTSNSNKLEPKKCPGTWDCKTVLMRGGCIVWGHVLSDRPTSIGSMGGHGVMGTADGLVHVWDVETGRRLHQLDDLQGSAVVSLATSSSSPVFATAGENKRVNLYLQKEVFGDNISKLS